MKYRKLGKTGIVVSEIGFGAWGIGGTAKGSIAYGKTDDQESSLALRLAYDLGVTYYDTSDLYGFGHSECLIGATLRDVRDKIVIGTKVGFLRTDAQNFSPKHIRNSLEKSLKRLKTDYIDLYQLHSPPMQCLKEDHQILSTLYSLVDEGKVRVIGISARSPDDALIAATEFGFKVLQVNFNLVDQRALTNGFFGFCEQNEVGIIARTPLCFGFLTGNYSEDTGFSSGDHRKLWSQEQIKKWDQARQLFLNDFKDMSVQDSTQLALRFCLSYSPISTVIPGILNRQHIKENTQASQFGVLSEQALAKIEKIYKENTFFVERKPSL